MQSGLGAINPVSTTVGGIGGGCGNSLGSGIVCATICHNTSQEPSALIGTVLQIKPLLKGDEEGRIVVFAKVRGRRQSIKTLAQMYDKLAVEPEKQTIGIAQAGCREDAEMLISLLKQNRPPKEILTVEYEPVTGSHVGPGALALFFLSQEGVRSYNGESMPNILQQVVTKAGDTASEALNKFKKG